MTRRPSLGSMLAHLDEAAAGPVDQDPAEQPSTDVKPAAEPATPAARKTSPARKTPAKPAAGVAKPSTSTNTATTARIGIYFRPGQFEAAKAAYLADWNTLPEAPDTFANWIAAAVETHARLTPAVRHVIAARVFSTEPGERGLTRSFNLAEGVVADMKKAIAADRNAGQWGSQSEFAAVAVAAAVEAARERAGGTLPPAPARLPNRLIR